MANFARIKDINSKNPQTYQENIFLAIDTDWAVDEVIADTISLLEEAKVEATWFCTHKTNIFKDIEINHKFEIGLHPNFNSLISGNNKNEKNADVILEELLNQFPQATSVRSHSLTQSTLITNIYSKLKITHDVNDFIPAQTNITLKPWMLWNGIIKVPFFWEDDVHILYHYQDSIKDLVNKPGLKVFAFHPIHIFLNTESIERYEGTRSIHTSPKELIHYRYNGHGTRTRFLEIINSQNQ